MYIYMDHVFLSLRKKLHVFLLSQFWMIFVIFQLMEFSISHRYVHRGVSINGDPQNGWFIRGHPIEKDDLGVPPFQESPKLP